MSDTLSEVLAGLTASDVKVDESGRIVIKDPDVARRLKELPLAEAEAAATNSGCNHNCKPQ